MAKLTTKQRKAMPSSEFALGKGHYPINDESHARNALARVSQFGDEREKTIVREKVKRKYPGINQAK